MKSKKKQSLFLPTLLAASVLAGLGACGSDKPAFKVDIEYDEATEHILVTVNRELKDDERLYARLRYGQPGELDCNRDVGDLDRIDGLKRAVGFEGPKVDDSVFEGFYDTSWLEQEPTPEMLERLAAGFPFIDVCLVTDTKIVAEEEFDPNRALDKTIDNGKADSPDEEVIRSVEAYADACVAELGEIPFFEKIGDGDYETYNCLDSVPIAMTVTHEDGRVDFPQEEQDKCDNPQYIYSSCEPNAVDGQTNGPRVTSASNDQGTHWVLLCRKAKDQEGEYNDIAMIGSNPYTGRTCFFQNALFSRTDGLNVSHPGDIKESDASPQTSSSIWKGIHGGVGSGIECGKCHSTDAFIHTPWIDQAKDANGNHVVPRMGEDDDYALGFNDAPYSLVNRFGQNWTMPQVLVSEEANACTRCHRIGNDEWTTKWIDRLVGEDDAWTGITTDEYLKFEHKFWMPDGLDGVDDETWPESAEGKAVKFIQECGKNPENCRWEDLPTEAITEVGELPSIDLEGADLALEAAKVLGASATSSDCEGGDCASRRCSECHSVSKGALRRWRDLTRSAQTDCKLDQDPEKLSQSQAMDAVNCLRVEPSDSSSVFAAEKVGVLSTGVQYGPFQRLFQRAFGDDSWLIPYLQFKARVGMPKGGHPKLSQREYAVIEKWFSQGLPAIDGVITEPPAPTSCQASHNTASVNGHLSDMSFDGWAAVNKENGINMFGCGNDNPAQCFSSGFANRSSSWGNNVGTIREVTEFDFRTSFWTRSSPDGRFIGNGGGNGGLGSTITDMATGTDIPVDASYDPGFFPDNSGFIFQGATGGAGICPNTVLTKYNAIEFDEPECISASGINLYQHVATGTGGNDYFVINSQFTSDPGNDSEDPTANFAAGATMKFTPMVFDGTNYQPQKPVIVDSPFEGDSVLSPSARLVISRLAGADGVSLGYVIRKVNITRFGDTYSVDISEKVATICNMQGAKAGFSFDERFVVTHHYEEDGTANLFLYDLQTKLVKQITDMPSGQRALFPHFRSDGWIYFLVKDGDKEFAAASDAAVVLAQ
jgi:hypothetical protein